MRFSKDVALSDFTEKICYPILRNRAVAAVFWIAKLAAERYPYGTDSAEDILIEAISVQLGASNRSFSRITREQISSLQRLAIRGAEAISTAIDFEEADHEQSIADLDLLISKCYSWAAALAAIKTQPSAATVPAIPVTPAVVSRSALRLATPTTVPRPTPRPVTSAPRSS